MTKINDVANAASFQCASLWYMSAPPAITANVVVTFAAAMDGATAGAVSFWNVKQGAPDAFNQSNTTAGATSTSVTTITANSTVIDIFGSNQALGNLAPAAGQTLRERTDFQGHDLRAG